MVAKKAVNPSKPTVKLCFEDKAEFGTALFGEFHGKSLMLAVKCAVWYLRHVTNLALVTFNENY